MTKYVRTLYYDYTYIRIKCQVFFVKKTKISTHKSGSSPSGSIRQNRPLTDARMHSGRTRKAHSPYGGVDIYFQSSACIGREGRKMQKKQL